MIGKVEKTVFDCADPRALAAFYAEVLGMCVLQDEWNWVVLGREKDMRELAFQKVDPYVPPQWPHTGHRSSFTSTSPVETSTRRGPL